ncbi:MAG: TIGR00730 family Rossman fold protein [Candidatus Puniceispirillaceae bacterium]
MMKKLCVFTGAATGSDPRFADAAHQLGQILASRNLGLVYGGGKSGLMGKIADAVIASDGHATGIIPKFLDNVEIAHRGLNDLHVIDTMHERKNMMYEIADGFIIMPGGLGTLDETMEIITWRQLGLHRKPIIIANLHGYWDHMLLLFQNIIDEGFMHHGHTGHFEHVDDMDALADKLDAYFPASHATASQI